MHTLQNWLNIATRRLASDSASQVRSEIEQHYEQSRDHAASSGASQPEADALAIRALGDPAAANCAYRKVLLTSAEAKTLRNSASEARFFCASRSRKWLLVIPSAAALAGAIAVFISGDLYLAGTLLVGSLGLFLVTGAPLLPVFTPSRGRVYRITKWIFLALTFLLAFKTSWLLSVSLWPLIHIESARVSLRRKLPVSAWPKHLYL